MCYNVYSPAEREFHISISIARLKLIGKAGNVFLLQDAGENEKYLDYEMNIKTKLKTT